MDFEAARSLLDLPSIVAWFALLVVVFAVFVGLGIYQSRRIESDRRHETEPRGPAHPHNPRPHVRRKEHP